MSDPPCPQPPLVPPEEKLWVGEVELRGTFVRQMRIYAFDNVTTVEGACDFAKQRFRHQVCSHASFEIENTEAFRNGG